ncbi:hypothetical protein B7435_26040 [Mycolicibacterium peregrinum]|nr:hypothetical protein B7435_26040 [Mycolicibacterium peregrinum]
MLDSSDKPPRSSPPSIRRQKELSTTRGPALNWPAHTPPGPARYQRPQLPRPPKPPSACSPRSNTHSALWRSNGPQTPVSCTVDGSLLR